MSLFVCFVLFLTDKEMWSEGDILSTLSVCQFSSISKSIGFTRGIKRLLSPAAVNHHHPLLWAYLSVLLHKPKNNCSVKTLKQTLQDKATNSSLVKTRKKGFKVTTLSKWSTSFIFVNYELQTSIWQSKSFIDIITPKAGKHDLGSLRITLKNANRDKCVI